MAWRAIDLEGGNLTSTGEGNISPMMAILMGRVGQLIQQREQEDAAELAASGFQPEVSTGQIQADDSQDIQDEIPDTLPLFDPDNDLEIMEDSKATSSQLETSEDVKKEEKVAKSKAYHGKKRAHKKHGKK